MHSVSFGYDDIDTWQAVALEREPGHIYSRNTNPTVRAFEEKIRDLEGAETATSFSSGMAAISGTFFALLRPGDRVVSIKDSYGGTNKLFTEFLPAFGIEVRLCATTDFAELETEVARGCNLLYLETPTNPTVKIVDIERLARAAHAVGALVVVDNTFATPINQNPLQLGADLVLHSATKYLGGHADALGGAACGSKSLIRKLYHFREINGAALAPMDAYHLLRGMKTLALRIDRQNQSALTIARCLQQQPVVSGTLPGSKRIITMSPGIRCAASAACSIRVRARPRRCGSFTSTAIRAWAANQGCRDSRGPSVVTATLNALPKNARPRAFPRNWLLSTGIEDVSDLIADLEQALAVLT